MKVWQIISFLISGYVIGVLTVSGYLCKNEAAVVASAPASNPGTWREGFKQANAEALQFKTWDQLYDWAEGGESSTALPLKVGRSTDAGGGGHNFIDTRAGGYRDGRIGIFDEMRFIGNHNSGDTKHFFQMTKEWIRMQDLDAIIPPGHF